MLEEPERKSQYIKGFRFWAVKILEDIEKLTEGQPRDRDYYKSFWKIKGIDERFDYYDHWCVGGGIEASLKSLEVRDFSPCLTDEMKLVLEGLVRMSFCEESTRDEDCFKEDKEKSKKFTYGARTIIEKYSNCKGK